MDSSNINSLSEDKINVNSSKLPLGRVINLLNDDFYNFQNGYKLESKIVNNTNGNIVAETSKGKLILQTDLPLKTGSNLVIEFNKQNNIIEGRIISIDGKDFNLKDFKIRNRKNSIILADLAKAKKLLQAELKNAVILDKKFLSENDEIEILLLEIKKNLPNVALQNSEIVKLKISNNMEGDFRFKVIGHEASGDAIISNDFFSAKLNKDVHVKKGQEFVANIINRRLVNTEIDERIIWLNMLDKWQVTSEHLTLKNYEFLSNMVLLLNLFFNKINLLTEKERQELKLIEKFNQVTNSKWQIIIIPILPLNQQVNLYFKEERVSEGEEEEGEEVKNISKKTLIIEPKNSNLGELMVNITLLYQLVDGKFNLQNGSINLEFLREIPDDFKNDLVKIISGISVILKKELSVKFNLVQNFSHNPKQDNLGKDNFSILI